MPICDAQVHIWAAPTPARPWPADGPARAHRPTPLTAAELLAAMDRAGVDRAVLVPPSWEGDYNDVVLQAASGHPDRFAVMGRFDIAAPNPAERLAAWRATPGVLGCRVTFLSDDHRALLASGAVEPFWAAAEALDVPLMLLPPDQIPAIQAVAERHPRLRIVIDHLAMTSSRKDRAAFDTVAQILPLARCPNVAVKASALPCYTTEAYPFPGIRDDIEAVFDAFGPDRMFWGTDLSRLPCSYEQAIAHFTETLPFLDAAAKARVMGDGLCDWLGWAR